MSRRILGRLESEATSAQKLLELGFVLEVFLSIWHRWVSRSILEITDLSAAINAGSTLPVRSIQASM